MNPDSVLLGARRRNPCPALTLRTSSFTILESILRSGVTVARLALNQLVKVQILAPQLRFFGRCYPGATGQRNSRKIPVAQNSFGMLNSYDSLQSDKPLQAEPKTRPRHIGSFPPVLGRRLAQGFVAASPRGAAFPPALSSRFRCPMSVCQGRRAIPRRTGHPMRLRLENATDSAPTPTQNLIGCKNGAICPFWAGAVAVDHTAFGLQISEPFRHAHRLSLDDAPVTFAKLRQYECRCSGRATQAQPFLYRQIGPSGGQDLSTAGRGSLYRRETSVRSAVRGSAWDSSLWALVADGMPRSMIAASPSTPTCHAGAAAGSVSAGALSSSAGIGPSAPRSGCCASAPAGASFRGRRCTPGTPAASWRGPY
jgi:hypothetical protein